MDFANGEITLHNSKSVPRRVALRKGTALHLKRWMFEPRRTDGDNLWDVRQPVDLVKRTVPRHTNGRWTAHSLRRAFAVTWLLADGSAPGLMATCGWTDPTMVLALHAGRPRADRSPGVPADLRGLTDKRTESPEDGGPRGLLLRSEGSVISPMGGPHDDDRRPPETASETSEMTNEAIVTSMEAAPAPRRGCRRR